MLPRIALPLIAALLLAACAAPAAGTPPAQAQPPAAEASSTPLPPSPTPSPTTGQPSDTPTAVPTETPVPTVTPTYVSSMRAKVIVDGRLSCRFGPGAPYLFKFTFPGGVNIELVGRMEHSPNPWVLAQAIGGNNRCWVNGGPEFLETQEDIFSLQPVDPHLVMAWSSYYGPMSNVRAEREGSLVTVSYSGLVLVPERGDESGQVPYVLEAWVCQSGEFVFLALGSYGFSIEVEDEPGCAETSRGRVSAAEKHGYVRFVDVDWPAYGPDD
ncbi:MAG: hypothetical protein KIS85_09795 [Anaerolineales bacterium]|nr:hypothetical protein [Anaerolineales bacterium]